MSAPLPPRPPKPFAHPAGLTVAPGDVWALLLYATRYCLGRRSYATSDAGDFLRRYGHALTEQQRKQIAREIREEHRIYPATTEAMPPDIVRGWLDVAGWLEEEGT